LIALAIIIWGALQDYQEYNKLPNNMNGTNQPYND